MFKSILGPLKKRFSKDREYYQILDTIFGISPNNIELYKLALIHRSASLFLEDGRPINNERLEFLGDAVLEAVVSDYLFIEFPEGDEGFLTQMRSRIVSRASLNQICVNIGLSEYIVVQSGVGFVQKHLYGDALEAMIGAIYLDKGFDFVNRLLINHILKDNVNLGVITHTETDFKSRLIEWCQKSKRTIVFETGHSAESTARVPSFRSAVMIDGVEMGYGNGTSKKEAEQHAAYAVSQALSDETGYHLLEMVDSSMEGAPGAADYSVPVLDMDDEVVKARKKRRFRKKKEASASGETDTNAKDSAGTEDGTPKAEGGDKSEKS